MECHMTRTSIQIFLTRFSGYCIDKHVLTKMNSENAHKHQCSINPWNKRTNSRRLKYSIRRRFCVHVTLEDQFLSQNSQNQSSDDDLARPLDTDELKSLIADSERTKLVKKLSEANQHNRFLKRQLHVKEEALVKYKRELAAIEFEIQALVNLAEEVAKAPVAAGTRRINGKYIQSILLFRLDDVRERIKEQIKDVDAARSKEVTLFWSGMAESVQVMGSFDGWSQGEHLSPEYTASFTLFSGKLLLRPGWYEIKFLVDGEWQLSPELPTVGEGLMENNLLIVS